MTIGEATKPVLNILMDRTTLTLRQLVLYGTRIPDFILMDSAFPARIFGRDFSLPSLATVSILVPSD